MKPDIDETRDIDEQPYYDEKKPCPLCKYKGDTGNFSSGQYFSCEEAEGGCGLYIEAPNGKIEELLELARKGLEKV